MRVRTNKQAGMRSFAAVTPAGEKGKRSQTKKKQGAGLTGERNGAHPPVHRKKGPVLVEGCIPEGVPVEKH